MNTTTKVGLMAGMMVLAVLAVSGSASAVDVAGAPPCDGLVSMYCSHTVGATTYYCVVGVSDGYYCVGAE